MSHRGGVLLLLMPIIIIVVWGYSTVTFWYCVIIIDPHIVQAPILIITQPVEINLCWR